MAIKRVDDAERLYWDVMVAPRLRGDEEIYEQPTHAINWDILAHARATLFPIDWPEPFGLVMVESMACGTPVIAHPYGAVPEIISDGTTGYLRDSVDAMVHAVGHTDALDPRQCRSVVERRFSAAVMTSRYEALYAELVDAANSSSRSVLKNGGLIDTPGIDAALTAVHETGM